MKQQKESLNTTDNKNLEFKVIEGTPFTMVKENNLWCGLISDKRLTEYYNNEEECKIELVEMSWNRIIQVVMVLNEKLKELK